MIQDNELEYRIPKKINKRICFKNGDVYSICPGCERILDREYMAFCDCCGQKLSWRGFSRIKITKK